MRLVDRLVALMMFLSVSGCGISAIEVYECPAFPYPHPKAVDELESINWDEMPYTAMWLGQIDILRDELEACHLTDQQFYDD